MKSKIASLFIRPCVLNIIRYQNNMKFFRLGLRNINKIVFVLQMSSICILGFLVAIWLHWERLFHSEPSWKRGRIDNQIREMIDMKNYDYSKVLGEHLDIGDTLESDMGDVKRGNDEEYTRDDFGGNLKDDTRNDTRENARDSSPRDNKEAEWRPENRNSYKNSFEQTRNDSHVIHKVNVTNDKEHIDHYLKNNTTFDRAIPQGKRTFLESQDMLDYIDQVPYTRISLNLDLVKCKVKLHLVVSFPLLVFLNGTINPAFKRFLPKFTMNDLIIRQWEYLDTLKTNLQHPCVTSIHILSHSTLEDVILHQNIVTINQTLLKKVHYATLYGRATMGQVWEYTSVSLLGKHVVVLNADIILGEGFEKINPDYLNITNVLYVLSRHKSPKMDIKGSGCNDVIHGVAKDFCDTYIRSHDAYVIYMNKVFSEKNLKYLHYPLNYLGAENKLIGFWKREYDYKLLNPCKVLKIYHNHCSNLHFDKRVRIKPSDSNNFYKIYVKPTSSLVV
ncbi:unnamed protein product [Owenia fusiformis]|uniref:Uncharacterized protein n=1 Tax=Owenia fusiformis TaxID=6347 RepID=A0A8S4Q697_OWEFU|nr:unnamed protein product [Owenia fusiformis]